MWFKPVNVNNYGATKNVGGSMFRSKSELESSFYLESSKTVFLHILMKKVIKTIKQNLTHIILKSFQNFENFNYTYSNTFAKNSDLCLFHVNKLNLKNNG